MNGYDANANSALSYKKMYAEIEKVNKDQAGLIYIQEGIQQLAPAFYVVLIEISVIASAVLTFIYLTPPEAAETKAEEVAEEAK